MPKSHEGTAQWVAKKNESRQRMAELRESEEDREDLIVFFTLISLVITLYYLL